MNIKYVDDLTKVCNPISYKTRTIHGLNANITRSRSWWAESTFQWQTWLKDCHNSASYKTYWSTLNMVVIFTKVHTPIKPTVHSLPELFMDLRFEHTGWTDHIIWAESALPMTSPHGDLLGSVDYYLAMKGPRSLLGCWFIMDIQ